MSKNKLHLLVDVLAYLCMVALASTGLALIYRLPHGSPRDGLTLLGLDRHGWGGVHWYLAVGLLSLVALHVVLHWKWVTNTVGALVRSRAARRAGAGAGGAVTLIVLGLVAAAVVALPWLIAVERGEAGSGRGSEGQGHGAGGHAVRGQTTLAGAAQEAGVPVARLIAELKLPADTDPTERLGHLRQEHGFEMLDVRDAVGRLKEPGRPAPGAKAAGGEPGRGGRPREAVQGTEGAAARPKAGQGRAAKSREGHDPEDCEETLRGRSTLAEAAREAGVPVARLTAELKLPADTDPRARLGHLRQQHGFDMEQVRAVVARLKDAGKQPK